MSLVTWQLQCFGLAAPAAARHRQALKPSGCTPDQALSDWTQRPVAHLCAPDLTPTTLHCQAQGWQHISLGPAQYSVKAYTDSHPPITPRRAGQSMDAEHDSSAFSQRTASPVNEMQAWRVLFFAERLLSGAYKPAIFPLNVSWNEGTTPAAPSTSDSPNSAGLAIRAMAHYPAPLVADS